MNSMHSVDDQHGENRPPARNVVLICTDQWRGDCLSIDGHPVVRTPYLDALATGGARFTRAYSATPTCVPARMALLTGLSQTSHRRVGYADGIPFDVETTMAGEFSRSGYQTQAIGKMHYSPERGRVGFDDVLLHDGYLRFSRHRERPVDFYDDYLTWLRDQAGESAVSDYFDDGIDCNSNVARPWNRRESLHPTNWVVSEATRWLYRRDPSVPFFLYLSFHRPHPPYNPPAWAFEQYLSAPDHEPPIGDWEQVLEPMRQDHRPDAAVAHYDQQTMNRARAGYYGNITHIDHQIERFRATLAEFGLLEDTIIVFTSDHGEMLGDHGMWRKGYGYEGSARVPLIVSGPGISHGTVIDEIVELRDIMPTLLAAAGLPAPVDLDGADLTSLLHADTHESLSPRSHLHGEHVLTAQLSQHWIRSGRWKYLWFSHDGSEQLFDLAEDPQERTQLAHTAAATAESADALARCRTLLIEELTPRPEGFVADGSLVAGRPVRLLLPPATEKEDSEYSEA